MNPKDAGTTEPCYVSMACHESSHLHFWCNLYSPHREYYPKNNYDKGEKVCTRCVIPVDGVMYRAPFKCVRESTPTPLVRCNVPRNILPILNSGASGDTIPVKEQKKYSELLRWLEHGETETERSVKKKIAKAGKKRNDTDGADNGKVVRLIQDNSKREDISNPETQADSPPVKLNEEFCRTESGDDGGLQGVPFLSMRDKTAAMLEAIARESLREVRSESDIPIDRGEPVVAVPALFERAMRVEYDPSYKETTLHSCITCKCGKKVWYGCGKVHHSRPKFCKDCEAIERKKMFDHYSAHLGDDTINEMCDKEFRRSLR